MKLSTCLILRDEGKTIYKCLDSMKAFVDEYVIGIDNKTSDNTEDEVKKFFNDNPKDNIIYRYDWKDSFSLARNEGMDKATGDYILIMDGHEFFPVEWFNITANSVINVQEVMKELKNIITKETDKEEVHINLYQQPFIGMTPNNFFLQPRIYKNRTDIRFGRDAHNVIKNVNQDKVVHFPEAIIIHDATEENRKWRAEQRIEMNTKALKEDIEKNPQDTRAMFYLGNTRMEAKDWTQAIYWFGKYLETRKDDNSEKYQVLLHKALCHRELKDWQLMRDNLHIAIGIDPYRRDAYICCADMYTQIDTPDWDKVIYYLTEALKNKPQHSRMFQNGPSMTWDPHQKLAQAYIKKGQNEKAIAHLKIAYSYLQNKEWADMISKLKSNKTNLLILDHIGSFTKEIVDEFRKDNRLNVVYLKDYDPRFGIWADRIFVEWGDVNALRACEVYPEKTVIRIHGYEAYINKQLLSSIPWDRVHKVVFVAEHIRQMLKDIIPLNKSEVIFNGVDAEKNYIKNFKRDVRNIGYAGYINDKKNPFLLLQIIKANPEKRFHLRIDWQSEFWKETFNYELKDCKNVIYHERYDNISDFWNQMSGVLSTSIIESFSFNIAEAMACGCRPYIYNWNGAKAIWPEKYIFSDYPAFKTSINKKEMEEYRQYITQNFHIKTMINKIYEVLFK